MKTSATRPPQTSGDASRLWSERQRRPDLRNVHGSANGRRTYEPNARNPEQSMIDRPIEAFTKVPAVTLGFWIVKVLATTLGETGGDTVSMSWGMGYVIASV